MTDEQIDAVIAAAQEIWRVVGPRDQWAAELAPALHDLGIALHDLESVPTRGQAL
jgi:hypothetical protein